MTVSLQSKYTENYSIVLHFFFLRKIEKGVDLLPADQVLCWREKSARFQHPDHSPEGAKESKK